MANLGQTIRQCGELRLPALYWGLAFFLLLSVLQTADADALKISGKTMGTHYNVVLSDDKGLAEATLREALEKDLAEVNRQMSTWQDDSEITAFNQTDSTQWVSVSAEFAQVVSLANRISEKTQGAYDVTAAPLIDLWGFGRKPDDAVPSDELIEQAKAQLGYQKLQVRIDEPALKKAEPTLSVNLSSIAKGFGVDVLAERLVKLGYTDFLVDIGGEIRTQGKSPRGDEWRIGIEKPMAGQRSVQVALALSDVAMATSGDYRNYFEHDGVRFSHTLNPRTGRPITHTLASVTVLADNTALADGWATALMVLGPEAGLALAKEENLAAFFLSKQGDDFHSQSTDAFEAYVKGRWKK